MIQSSLLSSVSSVEHVFTVCDRDLFSMPTWLTIPRQEHSNRIVSISHFSKNVNSDGLITCSANTPIGVNTADCVPILLVDRRNGIVSAVHAGWRGTLAGIVQNAVEQLVSLGTSPTSLFAAIGPSIKSCCYDIPPERAQYFTNKYGPDFIVYRDDKSYIDLQQINFHQLVCTGIPPGNIDVLTECTHCQVQYYSYRRGDRDKRMISYISIV